MTLKELINKKNYTIYSFAKESSIPKTTLIDLCNGKTSINKSQAITIKRIADTLGVSMEFIMLLESPNKDYLELDLPKRLVNSISNFLENIDTIHYDIYFCELQSDINVCEVDGEISYNQAEYLRKKYLGW